MQKVLNQLITTQLSMVLNFRNITFHYHLIKLMVILNNVYLLNTKFLIIVNCFAKKFLIILKLFSLMEVLDFYYNFFILQNRAVSPIKYVLNKTNKIRKIIIST